MDKAKHEYHELQKTVQKISTKNITEKSKLERYLKKPSPNTFILLSILVNIEKNVIQLKLVSILFNKKSNNIEN